MLRLLAQREQGYDDISALMGLSVEEVRAKVAGALSQIEDEGKPAPDVPPPEPKGPEIGGPESTTSGDEATKPKATAGEPPAQPMPQQPAAPPKPPAPPKAAPGSDQPVTAKAAADQAESKATPPAAAPTDGGSSGGGRTVTLPSGRVTVTLPSGRGLWPWIGGAVAIIAIVVIVILIAGGGGDSNSSSTEATSTTAGVSEETPGEEAAEEPEANETGKEASNTAVPKGVTQAVLKPVAGGAGAGKAIFGRVKNKLALQVVASGLETTGKNDSYWIWLAQSEQMMLPLASSAVLAKDKGKIAAQYEVPTEVLSYLANGTFDQIFITHTQNAQQAASLKEATRKKEAPGYTGETVLKGTVTGPIVGAALREEEEKEAEEKGE